VTVGRGRDDGQASFSAADYVFYALDLYIPGCNDLDEGVLGDVRKASPLVGFAVASGAADAGRQERRGGGAAEPGSRVVRKKPVATRCMVF
jgi:hypothetical protein